MSNVVADEFKKVVRAGPLSHIKEGGLYPVIRKPRKGLKHGSDMTRHVVNIPACPSEGYGRESIKNGKQ